MAPREVCPGCGVDLAADCGWDTGRVTKTYGGVPLDRQDYGCLKQSKPNLAAAPGGVGGQGGSCDNVAQPRTVEPETLSQGEEDGVVTTPPALAHETDILARFEHDLRLANVVGEERLAKLTYLCLTSRVLPWGRPGQRPVSLVAKGTSSSGKSYTTGVVLRFFPRSAYIEPKSMSPKYLLYTDEDLSHRFICIPEWSAISDDPEVVTLVRTLLSEGYACHGTVDGNGVKQARELRKEGPTGLLMTTTAAAIDAELETRCLSDVTDDSPEQTRRVLVAMAQAEHELEDGVHWESWHDLQTWIAYSGEHRTMIPFALDLARLMPDSATRLRRDFGAICGLIRAHAILHQVSRDRDEHGRIIATVDDYAAVRVLVNDLVAEGVDAGVPAAVRETVEAVAAELENGTREHVSMRAIVDRLGVGRTATYNRVNRALVGGYLVDVAKVGERGKKIATGAPLPGAAEFLPAPQAVVTASSTAAGDSGFGSTIGVSGGLSHNPPNPHDPPQGRVSGRVALHELWADEAEAVAA